MPMTARNVTQSDVAEAAGASGSFRSPCGSPTISRPSSTRRSPSAHDPRLAPSRTRAGCHEQPPHQKSRPAGTTAARTRCGRFPATVDRVLTGSGARPINRCPTTAVVGHLAGP